MARSLRWWVTTEKPWVRAVNYFCIAFVVILTANLLFPRPDGFIAQYPPPRHVVEEVDWSEYNRVRNLMACQATRDTLGGQCATTLTTSDCNKWAEATRICQRYEP